MIQRIQSLYLLLSAVLQAVCLCRPLGRLTSDEGERIADLYNLWLRCYYGPEAESLPVNFAPWALFALLLVSAVLTLLTIFLFKHRALQMRATSFCIILLVGYNAYLAFFVWNQQAHFSPTITAAFPLVAIVLNYLAFRGILKDELLVKSLDRVR